MEEKLVLPQIKKDVRQNNHVVLGNLSNLKSMKSNSSVQITLI